MFNAEPAVDAMRPPASVLIPPPALMVMVPAPIETVPEVKLTMPSSTSTTPGVCVPDTITVNAPVASLPAENTALRPEIHAAVAPVPSATLFQLANAPSHVPLGVAPPAPAVVPLRSQ